MHVVFPDHQQNSPTFLRTRHPGLHSMNPPSLVGWNEYPAKAGGVNRHIAWYTSPYPWSYVVHWCLAEGSAGRDQRSRTGSGSALEACLRRCAVQIQVYFTLLYFPCPFTFTHFRVISVAVI